MKKLFAFIKNIINFSINFFKKASLKRRHDEMQKEHLMSLNPDTLTSRQKDRMRENKKKIKDGQMSHYASMVLAFRKTKHNANGKVYLGAKNKQGIREILNGQRNAAERCELIIDKDNIKTLKSEKQILTELQMT